MKSLQEYKDDYRKITENLNLSGDSTEMLIEMFAYYSYTNDLENVLYLRESSLEKSRLINTKIQHCIDEMYSVYRGNCPRVVLRFTPGKRVTFNLFDVVSSSNNFKLYYLGYLISDTWNSGVEYEKGNIVYWDGKYWKSVSEVAQSGHEPTSGNSLYWEETDSPNTISTGANAVAVQEGFVYSSKTFEPSEEPVTIIALLAESKTEVSKTVSASNTYYIDVPDNNLSNDVYMTLQGEDVDITRQFAEHILKQMVFDLTLPGFGSRLYIADVLREKFSRSVITAPANITVEATYFNYTTLDTFNSNELKRIGINFGKLQSFGESEWRGYTEIATGIITIPETSMDDLTTIHYKAARDRFVNSILRSNSDLGTILEETYPEKIVSGGTTYQFDYNTTKSDVTIWYVPKGSDLLTATEISDFKSTKKAYYITDNLTITTGRKVEAVITLNLELYQSIDVADDISEVMSEYANKFGVNLEEGFTLGGTIISNIFKISNIKGFSDTTGVSISYVENGSVLDTDQVAELYKNLDHVYFSISLNINTVVKRNE